ncbi:unnamed protein product [Protopolystoma xenopodis]|uniref:Uncharacterized protein n=1 Tax=Protopolystoma xenopodis TaxID=117903 RepID=A0A3S5CL46_9PLAT|nr:unnamed protein product [Protopolystoma xenopodis]
MPEGKKVFCSSGFRGKGFQFDEAEAQLTNERKRFQKAAFGVEDSDEEDGEGGGDPGSVDWDAKIEDMFNTKRKVTDVSKSSVQAQLVQHKVQIPIPQSLAEGYDSYFKNFLYIFSA